MPELPDGVEGRKAHSAFEDCVAESLRHVWIKNNLTLYALSLSGITEGTKSKLGDQCLRLRCKDSREVVKRHYKEP